MIEAVRILASCRVAGRHLAAGSVQLVPTDVTADEAASLVRCGRGKAVDAPKPARRARSEAQELA